MKRETLNCTIQTIISALAEAERLKLKKLKHPTLAYELETSDLPFKGYIINIHSPEDNCVAVKFLHPESKATTSLRAFYPEKIREEILWDVVELGKRAIISQSTTLVEDGLKPMRGWSLDPEYVADMN